MMEDLRGIFQRLNEKATTEGFRVVGEYDDYDEGPDCELCGGLGWYTPGVPVGHPEFGQAVVCRCREARLEEERRARLLRYSNVGSLTRFTFEALDPDGRTRDPVERGRFRAAFDAVMKFATRPVGWLVLTGPHGSGKTHLAAAASNRLIDNGYVVFFVHLPELMDHLRATFSPASDTTYSDLFEQVKNTPILVLDELAAGSATPWAQEKLRQLVNHRYNGELPTIFTTVAPLTEVEPYLRVRMESPAGGLSRVLRLGQPAAGHASAHGVIEPGMIHRMTFDGFDARHADLSAAARKSLDGALQAARDYARVPLGWLTLCGRTGVGKTHLAVSIAGEQIRRGDPVFYASVPSLMYSLRNAFNPGSGTGYAGLLEEVKNAPLLILDDLGRERKTEWSRDVLYQIIVHRCDGRLPTVITASEDFIEQTGAARSQAGPIKSRIQDPSIGSLVRIEAPDYRRKGSDRGRTTA